MQTTPVPLEQEFAARIRPQVDVVVPVYNEEADLEPQRPAPARLPRDALPVHRSASRSPTTPAPTRTWPDRRPPGRRAARRRALVHLDREGPRPGAARGLVRQRRAGARLHGRRPVHRPRRAAAAGRAAALRPHRPRDRHAAWPAASRVVRGPKREVISRCYNLLLRATLRAALLRRPVRLQGDPRRPRARACCRWSRTPAGSSTPSCWCSPSAAGLRIHEVPVDWVDDPDSRVDIVATAARRPARASPGSAAALATGRLPLATLDPRPTPSSRRRAPVGLARQLVRFAAIGVRQHARLPRLLYLLLRGRSARRPPTLLALLVTAVAQHRRQPPAHLRRPRAGRRGAPPAPGPRRLRRRPGADQRVARRCCTRSPPAPAVASSSPCWSSPTSPPPSCASCCSARWVFRPAAATARRTDRSMRPPPMTATNRTPPWTAAPATARSPAAATPDARRRRRPTAGVAAARDRATRAWARPALLALLAGHRRCSTCGASAPRAGPTPSTPPPSRPARRAGRRSSSARSDAANSITVDKPPASLWVMALSVRIFGLNSWSILVPQALMGVATVGVLYADRAPLVRAGRRRCSPARCSR